MWLVRTSKWGVLVPWLVACAGGAPEPVAPARSADTGDPPAAARAGVGETARAAPLDPDAALGTADSIYRDQLAVGARDDRFSTDRQVAELRKAIALYQQFIERADGDPRFVEAVRRSQGRIDDAQKTIDFLLGKTAED